MKRRSALAAFFLSLLVPGLGQMYNADLRRGIAWFVGVMGVGAGILASGLLLSWQGLFLSAGVLLLARLWCCIDAAVQAERVQTVQLKPYNRAWIYLTIAAVLTLSGDVQAQAAIAMTYLRTYSIPSASMLNTLKINDVVGADMSQYQKAAPARGDLVVVQRENTYIKRVVALPGEIISFKGAQILINGQPLSEPYAYDDGTLLSEGDPPAATVPVGHVYVIGDNRNNSEDSRRWGPIPVEQLKGRVIYRFWPYNRAVNF